MSHIVTGQSQYSLISKFLEKLVEIQTFESHHILNLSQYGFQKISISRVIVDLVDCVCRALDGS